MTTSNSIDILLTSYSGLRDNISKYLPDNGLAKLAYNLLQNDIDTKILDLNSSEVQANFPDLKKFKNRASLLFCKSKSTFLIKRNKINSDFLASYHSYLLNFICDHIRALSPRFLGIKLWYGEGSSFWR